MRAQSGISIPMSAWGGEPAPIVAFQLEQFGAWDVCPPQLLIQAQR